MTRRDFQLIADVIAETRTEFGNHPPIGQLIARMGTALYGTNPRFDRGRFEFACEPRPSDAAIDRAHLQDGPMR